MICPRNENQASLFGSSKWAPPKLQNTSVSENCQNHGPDDGGWQAQTKDDLIFQSANSWPRRNGRDNSMPTAVGSEIVSGRSQQDQSQGWNTPVSDNSKFHISGLLESLRNLEMEDNDRGITNGWLDQSRRNGHGTGLGLDAPSSEDEIPAQTNIWGKPDSKLTDEQVFNSSSSDLFQSKTNDMDTFLEEIRLRQRKSFKARIPPPVSFSDTNIDNTNIDNVSLMEISGAPSRDSNISNQDQQSVSQMSVCLDDNIMIRTNPDKRDIPVSRKLWKSPEYKQLVEMLEKSNRN